MSSKAIKTKLSQEVKQNFSELKKSQKTRPNIDHLIKRILVERRSQERKNLIVFLAVLLVAGIIALFLYN